MISSSPHLRHRGSSVPGACVALNGVHQRVCGERVVGGPGPHILFKALDDRPVGPEDPNDSETHKEKEMKQFCVL